MELATLSFTRDRGWSGPLPALDSPRTLVMAFGWSELGDDPSPLAPLFEAGFYSYGEFSPHGESGRCELHTQTMTLTQISER
jgi:hypothetical protein